VDDDLLSIERGVEVRDDPHVPGVADAQRLGWRAVLAPRTERALLQLFRRGWIELAVRGTRPLCPGWRDRDVPSGQLVNAKIGQRPRETV